MMSLIDDYFKDVPEYYDSMCMDGYTPEQIRYALHKKMDRQQAEQEELADSVDSVKIKSEVKIKR